MSRSIAPESCRRPAQEFEGSDIVGHALDALDSSAIRTITILGRRGPHQIAMTPKELGELGHLEAASPMVEEADFPPVEADDALEPGHRKSITILRGFAATPPDADKPKRMVFDFFAKPLRIEGDGKAEQIIVERTVLDDKGAARGTGETYEVPASLVVTAIGYSTPPIEGVAYDERGGKFLNEQGRDCRAALSPSAGRGAGLPAPSAPIARTAMRSPTGLPPKCRPGPRRIAPALRVSSPCSRSAAS